MKNYWQGKLIRLRAFEEKDLEMLVLRRNSPDSLTQWYEDYIEFPKSEKELREEVTKNLQEYQKDDKKIFIIETLDGDYAGNLNVWYTDKKNGVFRYGILINHEYRGMGFAKESLIIVIDYYINELNYQKISPTVYSFNENSQKFHEKFGFILEGRLRNDIYTRGKYYDMLYYGMIKSEFNSLYKHNFK